ncbi:MAG: GTPase [Clostridia bacterium]|nr:GTPase [Clostridia bacterium]
MFGTRKVPVFIINGFLESGKTTFIKNAIVKDPKMQREKVLLVVCEEGEIEYDDLPENMKVHVIEEKEDVRSDVFGKLNEKYKPTFVIIEYNGIWGMQTLYQTPMPKTWGLADQMTVVDASTFESYFNNMKSIFADMLRSSTSVIMNRCTREDNFKFYKDSIKRTSPQTEIMYVSDEEGIMDIMLEEDLPYSLNDEVIVLDKDSYVTWYIDMIDNPKRYEGKVVEYVAQAARPDYFREGYFLTGNMVMTCCEDDMQFLGYVCKYDKAELVEEGGYVRVRAEIHTEHASEYDGEEGPVLYAKSVAPVARPKK